MREEMSTRIQNPEIADIVLTYNQSSIIHILKKRGQAIIDEDNLKEQLLNSQL